MRLLGFSMAAAVLLAGCASDGQHTATRRTIELPEFAAPHAVSAPPAAVAESNAPSPVEAAAPPPGSARGSPGRPGRRPAGAANPAESELLILRRPGDKVIVEGLIGQVNGRPIFADEFFEPIEDRILAAKREMPPAEFTAALDAGITQRLRELVNDQLFIAEAESELTPDQQKGVFAWLKDVQESTMAEMGGGTRKATETRVLEEEGRSLDDYLRMRKNIALINTLRLKKISPRVIVSWRDVELEYQKRYAEFNPPPTLTVARISISTTDGAERVDEIETRLASGETFAAIAESLGFEKGGQLDPVKLGPGGITDNSLAEPLKPQLAKLQPGQYSPPFEIGSSTWWIAVVAIDQPPHKSIYDAGVQQMLTDEIRHRREAAELERYLAMLRQRWVADDLEIMRRRLLMIADDRYKR